MKYKYFDFDPADASLTGFASNVTGATWTLTANTSGDSLAHQVSIRNDSATDHSGKTAVLVGTDADGNAQTETVALPGSSATVESTKYFLTLTSVTPSATIGADTMDIGWVDEFVSKTIRLDSRSPNPPVVALNLTGTSTFSIDVTNDNPGFIGATGGIPAAFQFADQSALLWIEDPALNSLTADSSSTVGSTAFAPGVDVAMAMRLRVESYTNGAEIQMTLTSPLKSF